MSRASRTVALLALLLAAPAASQPVTIERLWPNTDGLSWDYLQHYESYGINPQTVDNQVRMFFDGTTVAAGGIQAQYLGQVLIDGPLQAGAGDLALAASRIPDPLLRNIWVARPDLRYRIERAVSENPCPEFHPPGAIAVLLGGEFAWRRTADEVAAWRCNLDATRSWQWLASNLTIGSEFTLQLLPDLADDLFLHGTVAAIEPATVPAGTFADCVRVNYLIDYGYAECRDDQGNPLGTFRSETRGYVRYAPDVGPVESLEQFFVVEASGGCDAGPTGQPHTLVTMRLNAQTTPARRMSWGRLKASYR
jgi:hypothetical protein